MTEGAAFPKRPFILVVESIPDEMYKISEALKADNFRVMGAMDSESFTKSLNRELPDFIVIDVQLITGNGHNILQRLKEDDKTKNIKVIAVTSAEHEDRLWAEGADDILKKPVDPQRIIDSLKRFLGKG